PERPLVSMPALQAIVLVAAALIGGAALRGHRLVMHRGRLEPVVQHILALIIPEIVYAFACGALAVALAALIGLLQLVAIGHDDAAVVLGVLQIVLRQHRIAGGLGVARQRKIFLGNMRRRAADLHIRTIGFEAAR